MREILPYFSSNTYKLIFLTILIPTTFLPLRLLSVASLLGVVSTLYMVFLVFWDGLSKLGGPGSLWDPEPTDLIVWDVKKVGLSFGLFMAGVRPSPLCQYGTH
jgi:vesicular inhibitory amino acid transporter